MDDAVNEERSLRRRAWFWVAVPALIIVATAAAYAITFGGELSTSQSKWGEFGDFFGGVLNPLLSYAAFAGLIYSIYLQGRAADRAQRSADAQIAHYRMEAQRKSKSTERTQRLAREQTRVIHAQLRSQIEEREYAQFLTLFSVLAERANFYFARPVTPTHSDPALSMDMILDEGLKPDPSDPYHEFHTAVQPGSGTVLAAQFSALCTTVEELGILFDETIKRYALKGAPLHFAIRIIRYKPVFEKLGFKWPEEWTRVESHVCATPLGSRLASLRP